MVKNSKSALLALAAAGGLWAWRNRNTIQGWVNNQRSAGWPATGATRRFDAPADRPAIDPSYTPNEPYRSDI